MMREDMFAFSTRSNAWVPRLRGARALLELEQLRVATYNVWFDPYESERRRRAVFEILESEHVDVIALQEVTAPFLSALTSCPWVRAEYEISRIRFDASLRYDVVMLSRLPVSGFTAYPLTSTMGRKLHALRLEAQCGELTIAGVHLESMQNMTPARLVQIGECTRVLARSPTSVWMGDFNAAPESSEDQALLREFQDLWPLLSKDPGYTRDTTRNAMLAQVKDDRHQRIDRVLTRGDTLKPVAIRLLGTEALPDSGELVFPSDHFGLVADFACES
jgi:endonuclease/exonuclease/phosphatase family metal-dependent hydrolase